MNFIPKGLVEMINRIFEWEIIQMAINLIDYQYLSFTQKVLPVPIEKNMGVIGMKSMDGNGVLVEKGVAKVELCGILSVKLGMHK